MPDSRRPGSPTTRVRGRRQAPTAMPTRRLSNSHALSAVTTTKAVFPTMSVDNTDFLRRWQPGISCPCVRSASGHLAEENPARNLDDAGSKTADGRDLNADRLPAALSERRREYPRWLRF